MGAFGLAQALGIEQKAARDYIDHYFARFPGVQPLDGRDQGARRRAGYVETLFGRRRSCPTSTAATARAAAAPSARPSTRRCRAPRPT